MWTSPEKRLPRYFFEIDDGKHHLRDERGRELADQFAATAEAHDLLRTLRDLQGLEHRSSVAAISVRDDSGSMIYEGSLSLDDA